MFSSCEALTEIDVSNFNTQNVTDMSHMFDSCMALTEIDVSSFNTQNVTDMNWMFAFCKALTELDISNFNTQNVTTMRMIFGSCRKLKSLSLGRDFSFKNKSDELSTYSTPWVKKGTKSPTYTSSELMNTYDGSTMAGTYVRTGIVSVSLKKDDLTWNDNNIKVALYQEGEEVYSYTDGVISQSEGTITWNDVELGTYDVYASMDSEHLTTLVDTGIDIVTSD